ncbi:DEAD/DEAH box helicase family protein [Flagellimonas pacifica]|uniref:Type I restriction enzyme, R subunit n=1 Tax=Flagellimonas pacifica TaxID=1247520 RepID=A0A285MVR2_9FLAO|nr:DEAD/DEAH box helicase family protein [Allomuricauda parva]SNY99561.1 type I restriction enzyme, R subunit [Allomuricauda parva]
MNELDLQDKYVIHFITNNTDGLGYKEVKANTVSPKFFVVEDLKEFISETSLNKDNYRKLLRTKFANNEKALMKEFMDFLNEKIKSSMNMAIFINNNRSVTFKGYKLHLFYPSGSVSGENKFFEENIFSVVQELPYTYKHNGKIVFSFRPDITFFLNGIFLGYSELKSNWNSQNARKNGVNKVAKDYHKAVTTYLELADGNDTSQTIKKEFLKIFEKAIHITSTDVNETYIIRNISQHFDDIKTFGVYDYDKYQVAISKNFKSYPLKNVNATRQQKFEEIFRAHYSKEMIEKEILYYNFIERELIKKEGSKQKEYKHNDGKLISPRPKQKFGTDKIVGKISEFLEHENEPDYFLNKLKKELADKGLGELQIRELVDKRNKYQNNKNVYSLLLQYAAGFGKSNIIGWTALQLKDLRKDKAFVYDKILLVVDRVQLRDQLDTKMHNMNIHKKMFIEANNKKTFLEALESKTRVVVVNLQKFGTIRDVLDKDTLGKLSDMRVVFLIDEIHRSNSGTQNLEMVSLFDELQSSFNNETTKKKNLIIGFTATPSDHTLARFGEYNTYAEAEKIWIPFDSYTMRNAIDDGYILNPIKGIVPVSSKMYFELPDSDLEGFEGDMGYEAIPDNTETGTDEYGRKYRIRKQKVYANENRIEAISKFIVERLVSSVYHNIRGYAKTMLAVSSISSAIKYKKHVDSYYKNIVKESKYERFKDAPVYIVYSSDGQSHPASSTLNGGLTEAKVLQSFAIKKNGLIIVVDKLQTGFDEPKLHTLFLDKEIRGINAIQTISRVNRKTKYKNDCKIVDFSYKNINVKNIQEAFEHFSNVVVSDFNPLEDEKVLKSHFSEMQGHILFETYYETFIDYNTESEDEKDITIVQEITDAFTNYIHKQSDEAKKLKRKVGKYFQILNLIEFVIDLDEQYTYEYFLAFWRKYNTIYNTIHKPDEILDDVEVYYDNKTGIIAPIEYITVQKKSKVNEESETYGAGKQYKFHILAVIEKRNQEEAEIEKLIEDFENKISKLFDFVKEDPKGKRVIAKILDEGSAFGTEEIYDDFYKIFRKFINRNRKELGEFFIKETKGITNQLCDDFERILKEEQLFVSRKQDSLCDKSVQEIINNGETKEIEFKSSLRYCLREKKPMAHIEHSAFKNIAAFLNTNGGILLIGVEDNFNIIGINTTDFPTFKDDDKKDAFLKHFDNLLAKFLGNHFNSLVNIEIENIGENAVAKICIKKKAPEPVFLNQKGKQDEFYIRRSASAIALTAKEMLTYTKEHWS